MSVSRRFFLKSGALLSSLPLAATVAHAADPAATASRQVGPALLEQLRFPTTSLTASK